MNVALQNNNIIKQIAERLRDFLLSSFWYLIGPRSTLAKLEPVDETLQTTNHTLPNHVQLCNIDIRNIQADTELTYCILDVSVDLSIFASEYNLTPTQIGQIRWLVNSSLEGTDLYRLGQNDKQNVSVASHIMGEVNQELGSALDVKVEAETETIESSIDGIELLDNFADRTIGFVVLQFTRNFDETRRDIAFHINSVINGFINQIRSAPKDYVRPALTLLRDSRINKQSTTKSICFDADGPTFQILDDPRRKIDKRTGGLTELRKPGKREQGEKLKRQFKYAGS